MQHHKVYSGHYSAVSDSVNYLSEHRVHRAEVNLLYVFVKVIMARQQKPDSSKSFLRSKILTCKRI